MRPVSRFGSVLVLGCSLALGACGGREEHGSGTTATAGGEAAASASAPMDSTGTALNGAGNGAGMNSGAMADLAGMKAEDQLAILGASNAAEILTSKAAEPKLTSGEAKAYARDMQAEHKAMQGMADKLATRLNLTPGTPDLAKQKTDMANQMAQQLDQNAKGTAYDRQYIDGQVLAHQQTLEQLRAMQNAQNAELKTLVVSAIPKVEMHLQRAQKIQQQLGGTGGMGSSGSSTSGAGNNVGNTSGAMNSGGTTP